MPAEFQGKSASGELLTGFEEFSPRIWPYTTKEAAERLTPGVVMLVGIDEKNL